ncbi:ABC transporter permease [Streptomyces yaizuensis]|uniref:ABC transporter permease n=1 Tax=Streptomyces yaizuensis TaxID=2989713 RepID=A0ABQ5P0M1_9ACTN|nr:ABC transporter permease [Streptomyces sp. YSPA8]GLF95766.1 ABC transporter permease [Streptomyces sp. YSPA8]
MSSQTPGAVPETTRIHNIGYRNYEGRRLGRAYARRSLFVQSLRGSYGLGRSAKSKIMPMILAAIMVLPAAIIVAVAVATKAKALPIEYSDYALALQPVIWLYLASQAPQSVSRDLRFRTIPLYFSRPIERLDYVTAKYGAMVSALLIFTTAPLLVLYFGALLAKMDFADQTEGFGQGLVGVVLLSLLFGGIGLVLAALTPRRGFGVAAIIATLVTTSMAVTVVQLIADSSGSSDVIPWFGLFSPTSLIGGVSQAFLGAQSDFRDGAPGTGLGLLYVLVILALSAGSYAALMRRYAKAGL